MSAMDLATGLQVLAAQEPEGPEFGKASPLGLLVIILLLVGTALLIRSMNTQLKKLPKSFDTEHPEPDQAFDEGTDAGASDAGVDDRAVSPDTPVSPDTTASPNSTDGVHTDGRRSADT